MVVEEFEGTIIEGKLRRLDPSPELLHFRLTEGFLLFDKDKKLTTFHNNTTPQNNRRPRKHRRAFSMGASHVVSSAASSTKKKNSDTKISHKSLSALNRGRRGSQTEVIQLLEFSCEGVFVLDEIQRVEILESHKSTVGEMKNCFVIVGRDEAFTVKAPDVRTQRKWVHYLGVAIENARLRHSADARRGLCDSVWHGLHVDTTLDFDGKFCELKDVRTKVLSDTRVNLSLQQRICLPSVKYKSSVPSQKNRRRSMTEAPILRRMSSVLMCTLCRKEFGLMSSKTNCEHCGGVFHTQCTRKQGVNALSLHSILETVSPRGRRKSYTSSTKVICNNCFWDRKRAGYETEMETFRMRGKEMSIEERFLHLTDNGHQNSTKLMKLLKARSVDILFAGKIMHGDHKKPRVLAITKSRLFVSDLKFHSVKRHWKIRKIGKAGVERMRKDEAKVEPKRRLWQKMVLHMTEPSELVVLRSPVGKYLIDCIVDLAKSMPKLQK